MMCRLLLFPVVAALGAAGCTNTLFPLAPDQLFETQVRANCSYAFHCCEAAERNVFGFSNARDEGSCVEQALEASGEQALVGQRAKAAIDAGTAAYDGDLAERCLRPFLDAAQHCDPRLRFLPTPDACAFGLSRGFAVGTVKDGEPCTDSIECADEGSCIVDAAANTVTVSGTCAAAAGDDEDCSARPCKTGLRCVLGVDVTVCKKIERGLDGTACTEANQCASGVCVPTPVSVCAASGAPCGSDGSCADGDVCNTFDQGTCGPADDVNTDICDGQE